MLNSKMEFGIYSFFPNTVAAAVLLIFLLSLLVLNHKDYAQQNLSKHGISSFGTKPVLNFEEMHSSRTLDQLDRYDVKFYKLDISVSSTNTLIQGKGLIYAEVQNSTLDTFVVELIDSLSPITYMIVDSLFLNGVQSSFVHSNHLIKVPANPGFPVSSRFTAEIYYHGDGGSTSVTNYNGISTGTAFNSSVSYTYSEPFWSKIWWPCKQVLSDKADSLQVSITTESNCKAGSNGILKSVVPLPGNKVRYDWVSNYPVDFYLVSFAVGQYIEHIAYAEIEGTSDSILIQSYLFQDCPYLPMHLNAIEKTKAYLNLFSKLYGGYPFKNEKYGYCLTNSDWGAMENQTMTTIGYQALDTTAASIGGYYYYWYSAHEIGHSWFGDNVTCATWQDIWINEGFASYSEYLALQYLESQSSADFWMNNAHQIIMLQPGGSVYIPVEYSNDENIIFDYRLTYKKGAAIVHILRNELANDSIFFQTLKNFQYEFKYGTASALDFKNILEITSGQDFTDFFDQWFFGEGYPKFNIHWSQVEDTLIINSSQTTSSPVTPLFRMPVDFKLYFNRADTTIRLYQASNQETFRIYFPHSISNVEFDPDNWIINQSNIVHTGIEDEHIFKNSFYLYPNYPNPFNPVTKIKFSVPNTSIENSHTKLVVFDLLGKEIATLVDEVKKPGSYEVEFDARDLSSGVYLYRLQIDDMVQIKKMILLK